MNDFEWINDIETLERITDITQLKVGDRVKVTTMCDDINATDEYGYVKLGTRILYFLKIKQRP